MHFCNKKIPNSCSEKLLDVTIDSKFRFEKHVEDLCKRASQKVSALAGFHL